MREACKYNFINSNQRRLKNWNMDHVYANIHIYYMKSNRIWKYIGKQAKLFIINSTQDIGGREKQLRNSVYVMGLLLLSTTCNGNM